MVLSDFSGGGGGPEPCPTPMSALANAAVLVEIVLYSGGKYEAETYPQTAMVG